MYNKSWFTAILSSHWHLFQPFALKLERGSTINWIQPSFESKRFDPGFGDQSSSCKAKMFDLVKITKNYCVLESNITIYDKPPCSAVLYVTHLPKSYCGFCSRVFVHKLTPSLIHHGPQKRSELKFHFEATPGRWFPGLKRNIDQTYTSTIGQPSDPLTFYDASPFGKALERTGGYQSVPGWGWVSFWGPASWQVLCWFWGV